MATPWAKAAGGLSMADRMKADLAADRLKQQAASAFAAKVAAAQAKFQEKYGETPDDYILNAKTAAYGTSSSANNFQGRSRAGKRHTTKAPQTKEMKGDIKEYHDLEEQGKTCAQGGDIVGAIESYEQALAKRISHEQKHSKATDAGHDGAKRMLRERSNSLIGLKNRLDQSNAGVAAAKLLVKNFFLAEGINYGV